MRSCDTIIVSWLHTQHHVLLTNSEHSKDKHIISLQTSVLTVCLGHVAEPKPNKKTPLPPLAISLVTTKMLPESSGNQLQLCSRSQISGYTSLYCALREDAKHKIEKERSKYGHTALACIQTKSVKKLKCCFKKQNLIL